MTKTIITIILGTILLFAWNAVSWMVLPFHGDTLNNIPENAMQVDQLKNVLTEDGVYHYPGLPENNSKEAIDAINAKLQEGPRITMMVYKTGSSSFMDPKLYVGGLIINLLTAIFALILISKLGNKSFANIMVSCITVGIIIALVVDISWMNWYLFPLDYTLINVLDRIVAFVLLGLLFSLYTFNNSSEG